MATSYPAYGAPPQGMNQYPPPTTYNNSANTFNKGPEDARRINRTPSPTPSEEALLLNNKFFDYSKMLSWKFWIRKEWLWYYIIGAVILTATILVTIFHDQIVTALKPVTTWMHGLKYGFFIPVAVLFVLSFPPLFGQEIVHILCGLVWGLWVGFAIVAAGTFLGEIGNFYAFRYCCRARGEKMEKDNIQYACLAHAVRDGGFVVALVARLSVIPGHFTTAIFSTCGMTIWVFAAAAFLSLPKQFITVYIGVILEQSGTGTETSKNKLISDAVLGVTVLISIGAMWYILRLMRLAKPDVIYARRKARQEKMQRADFASGPYSTSGLNDSNNSEIFNPQGSGLNIPLNPSTNLPYGATNPHQQWGKDGRAVGYAADPRVYAPEPQPGRIPTFRPDNGGGNSQRYTDGASYPPGSGPVRQESGDSVSWDSQQPQGGSETYNMPRITASPPQHSSPAGLHEPMGNAFTAPGRQTTNPPILAPPPSFSAPSGAPPHLAQSPPTAQYASYPPQPPGGASNVQSPPLPNPFGQPEDATPTQFTHPQTTPFVHASETTDPSFHTAEGHSGPSSRVSSPPTYPTNLR